MQLLQLARGTGGKGLSEAPTRLLVGEVGHQHKSLPLSPFLDRRLLLAVPFLPTQDPIYLPSVGVIGKGGVDGGENQPRSAAESHMGSRGGRWPPRRGPGRRGKIPQCRMAGQGAVAGHDGRTAGLHNLAQAMVDSPGKGVRWQGTQDQSPGLQAGPSGYSSTEVWP